MAKKNFGPLKFSCAFLSDLINIDSVVERLVREEQEQEEGRRVEGQRAGNFRKSGNIFAEVDR